MKFSKEAIYFIHVVAFSSLPNINVSGGSTTSGNMIRRRANPVNNYFDDIYLEGVCLDSIGNPYKQCKHTNLTETECKDYANQNHVTIVGYLHQQYLSNGDLDNDCWLLYEVDTPRYNCPDEFFRFSNKNTGDGPIENADGQELYKCFPKSDDESLRRRNRRQEEEEVDEEEK